LLLQDKLGPFCRSAEDCTVVLDTVRGKDPDDLSSRYVPLDDPFSVDIKRLTVGYTDDAEMEVSAPISLSYITQLNPEVAYKKKESKKTGNTCHKQFM
jgi:Asp-tRNA(Asn)/Glu-tRNA(Gln) amidotransferase A subunit family amidase